MMKNELAKRSGSLVKLEPIKTLATKERDWTEQGVLTRHTNGAKAYLRQSALVYFLDHCRENTVFTNRTIPLADELFGSGDFYVILSWLIDHNLVIKDGSRYAIPSKQAIVIMWNRHVDQMRL